MISLMTVAVFLVLLVLGTPIAVSLGLAATMIILAVDLPLQVIAQRTVNAIDSLPLLAVPLFIFGANLFNASGLTDRIFDFARLLIGHLRGGLAQVTIIANLVFSGISGAAFGRHRRPGRGSDAADETPGLRARVRGRRDHRRGHHRTDLSAQHSDHHLRHGGRAFGGSSC